jgi:hypothetical protein
MSYRRRTRSPVRPTPGLSPCPNPRVACPVSRVSREAFVLVHPSLAEGATTATTAANTNVLLKQRLHAHLMPVIPLIHPCQCPAHPRYPGVLTRLYSVHIRRHLHPFCPRHRIPSFDSNSQVVRITARPLSHQLRPAPPRKSLLRPMTCASVPNLRRLG